MKIKKICKQCGKEFEPWPGDENTAKYCSRNCYYESRKTGKTIKCDICGREIYKMNCELIKNKINYCSFKCAGIGKEKKIKKKCKKCGEYFETKPSSRRIYCGWKCSKQLGPIKTGFYKKCHACGKNIYIRWSRFERNRSKKYYCSFKCRGKYYRKYPNKEYREAKYYFGLYSEDETKNKDYVSLINMKILLTKLKKEIRNAN